MENNETHAITFDIETYLKWCKRRNKKPGYYTSLQEFRYLYNKMIYY